MKFLHTADWHVGANRILLPGSYLDRQMAALREIFDVAEERADGNVVVAGDIFDSKAVRESERSAVLSLLEEKDRQGFNVIVINGNHDILETRMTSLRPIVIFKNRLQNLRIAECEPQILKLEGQTFVLYPPWSRFSLNSKDAMSGLRLYLKEKRVKDAVLISHFTSNGSVTETGYRIDNDVSLGGKDLAKRVSYWALGDVHRVQCVNKARTAWFSGNPLHHKWGENEDKGVLIVDTDDFTRPEFVQLKAAAPMLTVYDIPSERPGGNALCRLLTNKTAPADLPDWILASDLIQSSVVELQEKVSEAVDKSDEDEFEDLPDILKDKGLTDDEVEWCVQKTLSASASSS